MSAMNEQEVSEFIERIDLLSENLNELSPLEAERRIVDVLATLLAVEGYLVRRSNRTSDEGFDYFAHRDTTETQASEVIAVQYKHRRNKPVAKSEVAPALVRAFVQKDIDRLLILTNHCYTHGARSYTQIELVTVELLDLQSLKSWAFRIKRSLLSNFSEVVKAITDLSKKLARLIATNPDVLTQLEWRDMERMLAAVLEGFGFRVCLTPPSKDGGKDIILECIISGASKTYIVEVKHWRSGKRVGMRATTDFVRVVAKERRDGGLYLATSGYCLDAFQALTELERQHVRFGRDEKIISLCRTYVRAESGIWSAPDILTDLLFGGTE